MRKRHILLKNIISMSRQGLKTMSLGTLLLLSGGVLANSGASSYTEEFANAMVDQNERHTVTGTVSDAAGPLIGVNIMEVGTQNGTITDLDGNYSITLSSSNATLSFYYIGYETKEVKVAGNTVVNVSMQEDTKTLDEVVVVGYGTQRRASITGSVSSIDNSELVKAPVADLTNSLGGKLPGLRSINRGGVPGANASEIDIRGFGSALIVIDGIPGEMNQIDPNEVESITILKDASAAVYGVRAANGVLLVTTKRGKAGKTSVEVNSTFTWQRPTTYPKLANAAQFVELTDEDLVNRGNAPAYGAEELAKWRAGGAGYQSYDWYDNTVQDWSPQQQHNLNIRGGNEDINYFTSVGYLNQEGMWKSGDLKFDRFNFRSNLDAKIKGGLSASLSISGRKEKRDSPNSTITNIMAGIQKNYPVYSPYANNNKDYYAETNSTFNPLAYTDSDAVGYDRSDTHFFEGSFALKYDASKFVKGLSAKAQYYYRYTDEGGKKQTKKYSLYRYDPATETYNENKITDITKLDAWDKKNMYKSFQGTINYSNVFAQKHAIDALFVFETRQEKRNSVGAYREYIIDSIDEIDAGMNANKNNSGTSSQFANIGYIGRVNYGYADRYLAEVSFRYDGTSRFPSRWGFFPSISAGWRISEEAFMKDKVEFLDNLKLRASWGRLGDEANEEQDAEDNKELFRYLTGYNYPDGSYIFGNGLMSGLVDSGLANPLLTWYTSDLYNIGLDFGLFNGKLTGEIDVFYRKRKDLLATRAISLPGTFGATLPHENLDSDSDRGYELTLTHRNRLANGFEYLISGNLSYTRSKYEHQESADPFDQYANWRNNNNGRWKNRWWGYTHIGQFQSYEEIASSPVQDGEGNRSLMPGDIKYLDYNGDGVIDENDEHLIGRGNKPEYMFGLNLSGSWKGFDLSVFFQGSANFNFHSGAQLQVPFFNGENTMAMFTDRWRRADIYDPNSQWIAGKYPSTYAGGKQNNTKASTFWLQDASYVRMKEIQVGYTIPSHLLRSTGVEKIRVFFTGYNLFTITGVDSVDPETLATDGRYYPQQKTISFGFNISL